MQVHMEQIFIFFNSTQASLILYLCTSCLLIISLMININYWKRIPFGISRRLAVGLLVMLLVELGSLAANMLFVANQEAAGVWLPPIDRFQMAFLLLWLMWIWAFPESSTWADTAAAFLAIGLFISLILSLSTWSLADRTGGFNAHWLDLAWQLACLGYLMLMVLIIYIRRRRLWGAGILTGLLFIGGFTLQIITPYAAGNYPGVVRLVTLIALPLLLLLPQRFITPPSSTHNAILRRGNDKRDRRRFSTELPTALGFLSLAWEDNPQAAMLQLVKSIGQALLADVCLFTTHPNQNGQLTILTGFDFSNQVEIKEIRLDRQRIPLIADALNRTRNLRLPEDYNDTPDIASLCRVIRHSGTAPLLVHPVSKANAWQIGGILLMTHKSRRMWTAEDSTYVDGLVEALIRIIEHNQSRLLSSSLIQNLTDEQRESGQTIINLQNELQQLYTELETSQSRVATLETTTLNRPPAETMPAPIVQPFETEPPLRILTRDATIRLDPLVAESPQTSKEIARLHDENDALRQLIAHISASPEETPAKEENQPERELRLSLEEVARLKNMLADADMKIRQLDRKLKGGS